MWDSIPACLPDPEMSPDTRPGQCWMVGVSKNDIYQVEAEFISDQRCNEIWTATDRIDYSSQFCARAKNFSKH